jgi:hypothetical protein
VIMQKSLLISDAVPLDGENGSGQH